MEEDVEAETRFEPASRRNCEVKPEHTAGVADTGHVNQMQHILCNLLQYLVHI